MGNDLNSSSGFSSSSSSPDSNESSWFKSTSSFQTKTKRCFNDPENPDQFMICKTTIKDNKGVRQQEERVPIRNQHNQYAQNSQNAKNSQYHNQFGQFRQNSQPQASEEGFFNTINEKASFQTDTYFPNSSQSSYHSSNSTPTFAASMMTKSKSCSPDPEDSEYMICKSTVYDGQQYKESEQKIPIKQFNQQQIGRIGSGFNSAYSLFGFPQKQRMFPAFGQEMGKAGNDIDEQLNEMMKSMNSGLTGFMFPLIGEIANVMNDLDQNMRNTSQTADSLPRQSQYENFAPKSNRHPQEHSKSYFTTSNQKDTTIYDL